MLGKFKDGNEWILPLLSHVSVHGVFTLLITLMFNTNMWWIFLLDMGIHFIMDRIKASKGMLGRFKIEDKRFWWSLGFDQAIHHCTHYFLIYMLIN